MARAARAPVEPQESPDNDPVDIVHETDDFRSGQVSEGELELARSVAKRMGWTPKEEWKRDPTKWVDAPEFLENTPRELETVKERLKRTNQAAEAVIEDERKRAREQALAEIRAAAAKGGPEGEAEAAAAAQRLADSAGPPPQVQAWINRNAWFNEDPEAQDFARSVTQRLQNRPIAEQLEAAEAAVRRRFPEHFEDRREEPTETRLSQVPRPPVQSGTRGASVTPREKGWADLPQAARTGAQKFVKAYRSRGLSEADAQNRYARAYWSDQA